MAETPPPSSKSASGKAVVASVGNSPTDFVTTIHRPAAGSIQVVEIPPGANIKFDFNTADTKVVVLDVDLVLLFNDGGKIIIPGFAFDLVGTGQSEVAFLDKLLSSQELLAKVGEVRLMDDSNLPSVGSASKENEGAKEEKAEEKAPDAPPTPPAQQAVPAAPGAKLTGVADFDKPPEDPGELAKKPTDTIITAASSGSPPSSNHTSDNSGTGNGDGNVVAVKLDVTLLGVSGVKSTPLVSGGQDIRGAAAVTAATTDKTFSVQQTPETLVGTAAGDVIYADDPTAMPKGTSERLIDIKAEMPDEGVVATKATITNLPTGYAINNATKVGDNWVIDLDKLDPNHLQLELVYVLPTDSTHPDANGFLGNFSLNILFSATDAGGAIRLYSGSQTFVIKDIQSEADVTIVSTDGKTTIYALNATPPGTNISAGGGDDTVYAGAGHDTLDGGAGNNILSYALSNSGVTVDLGAGTGSGGYAAGDILSNFTSIVGSSYADRLTGTSGDNTFFGSGGADTFIGAGGNDWVDYSTSSAGVTVDLDAGTGSGGQAEGNLLVGISNVIGSATGANALYGTAGANVITGGSGADTIDGRGGTDVITAGGGADTVSYYGSEVSVAGGAGSDTLVMNAAADVDLTSTGDQTSGDGTLVTGFENVEAGTLTTGIRVTGDASTNVVTTGSGNDTIHGGGGLDVIKTGGGNDTVDYFGTEVSIDGGTGSDTLVIEAQVSVDLTAVDQTLADTTTVTGFDNVDGSALTAGQSIRITGTTIANTLLGGGGNDTIDGGGGSDSIAAGAGDDVVVMRGSENVVDGGSGTNSLVLASTVTASIDLAAGDQSIGDAAVVTGFTHVDGSAVTAGIQILGTAGVNSLSGGAGADTLDGRGGLDTISAGAGDDTVGYWGSEAALDGGTGSDTLLLRAGGGISAIDLASAGDQTVGDSAIVTRFENVDGSTLGAAQPVRITGSLASNTITGGAGSDTIDGGGGSDSIQAAAGDDVVTYWGSEVAIDGGTGTNTLILQAAATVNLASADQTSGDLTAVTRFTNVDASALSGSQSVTLVGSSGANALSGGSGADTIDGSGGADTIVGGAGDDRVAYWGTEASIDGGTGTNTIVLKAAATVDLSAVDQTSGDVVSVVGFGNVDASGLGSGQAARITGSAGANVLTGGAGADTIDGGSGADAIDAGAGADQVTYRGTETSVEGGAGVDTLVIASTSGLTGVNLGVGSGSDQTTGDTVAVADFENVDASAASANLTLTGSSGGNLITGGSGADTIRGAGGADVIQAGGGDDRVDYWGSEQTIDGGSGSNTLEMKAAANVDLGAADQTVGDATAVTGFVDVDGSGLSTGVSISGSAAANRLTGGSGADTIAGGGGLDTIVAGAGDDTVQYGGTEASIDGGVGADTLRLTTSGGITAVDLSVAAGADQTTGDTVQVANFENVDASILAAGQTVTIIGSTGSNVITGGAGADTIRGGGGTDAIVAGGGDDRVDYWGSEVSIDGGTGSNTLVMQATAVVNLANADQTTGDLTAVTGFVSVDASGLTSAQAVSITGSTGANTITGGAGGDTIHGLGGADAIDGGAGDDHIDSWGTESSIIGGAGLDTLVLAAAVTVDLSSAGDQTTGDAATASGFESVDASGLSSAVRLTGSSGANTITGGAGADTIDGGGGLDEIRAGSGNDQVGYHGSEVTIDGEAGTNTLVLATATTVNLGNTDQTSGDATQVANFQNVDAGSLSTGVAITGASGDNRIIGGSGADTIRGAGGNDTIQAGGGDDTVDYWASEGSIDGGTGTNTLVMKAAATVDLAQADQTTSDATTVTGFADVDASALSSGVRLTGSTAANRLTGGAGDDTIAGGGGNDVINAGSGNDTVTFSGSETTVAGGSGSDTLVLSGAVASAVDLSVSAGSDQTTGDTAVVTGFESVDASILTGAQTISLTGSTGANTLTGGAGADTIRGGGGADVIQAGAGDDRVDYWGTEATIDGGAGANTLALKAGGAIDLAAADQTSGDLATVSGFQDVDGSALSVLQSVFVSGTASVNRITGGAGADTIDGQGGADVIDAGGGDDQVVHHGGEASITGGSGSDTLVLTTTSAVGAVDLSVAAGTDQTSGDTVTVADFESIDASALTAGLTLTGSIGNNTIKGGGGADTIDGNGGADVIDAGGGNDSVAYHGSETTIAGGTGTNTLVLKAVTDINLANVDQTTGDLTAVTGFQNLDASGLTATQGIDATGSAQANRITGGAGADTLDGGGGADTVVGGAGDDTIAYRGAEASLDGGTGTDTLLLKTAVTVDLALADQTVGDATTTTSFQAVDAHLLSTGVSLSGTTGADSITGGAGADTIHGRGGGDVVDGGAGDDLVDYEGTEALIGGGGGADTLVLDAAGGITAVDLGVASGADQTIGDTVTVTDFENVDATILSSGVQITGSAAGNRLTGGAGDDTIHGAGGADVVHAGAGADRVDYWGSEDTLDGGIGTNTLVMKAAATVDLSQADQTLGDATNVLAFQNVDASALSSGATLTGTASVNQFIGGAGDDTIDGADGADVITGGAGDDRILYHGGEASLDGGTGNDTLVLAVQGGITTVNLSVAAGADQTVGDGVAVANFQNVDASVLSAAQTITLVGSGAANQLTGGAGNDTIHGAGGADVVQAGAGDDTVDYWGNEASLAGGTGTNTLVLKTGATLDLASVDQSIGDAAVVSGFQNIDGSGLGISQGSALTGSTAANVITGGAGADTIDGGGGADVVNAGAGNDTVTFRGSETSIDGGAGTSDTLVLAAAATIGAVDLSAVDQTSGDTPAVSGFENVDASARASGIALTGSSTANTITGGSGADTIHGGGGSDSIQAAGGDDRVDYGGSETAIDGGAGTNTLVLTVAATVDLGSADQTTGDIVTVRNFQNIDASAIDAAHGIGVVGSSAANQIIGGAGADTLDGAGGTDVVTAGGGDDTVTYRGSETTIDGEGGSNTLVLATATTVDLAATADQTTTDTTSVVGFAAVDAHLLSTGVALSGTTGADTITGGAGADTITGRGGGDVVDAGAGTDTVHYRGGEASVDGGAGVDTLVLDALGGITAIDLSVTPGLDQTSGDGATVIAFENVDAAVLSAAQGLAITGSTSTNALTGGAGNDTIDGFGGTDTIVSGAGNDRVAYRGAETSIDGGTGTNTLVLKAAVTVDLANADQTSGDTSTVSGFQAVDGSGLSAALSLSGTTGVDTLIGGSGADTLDGRGGADSIDGGAGNDTVNYRGAEATIDGGAGTSDTLVLKTLGAITAVNLAQADQTIGDATAVTGFENLDASILSAAQGLAITGSSAANRITGGAGNDTIQGAGGADVLQAGAGDDTVDYNATETSIDGGSGTNTLVMKAAATVDLSASDQTAADATTVTGFTHVDASALDSAHGVRITGSTALNTITGGAGDDTIDGGTGADVIAAGAGADTVLFRGTETTLDGGAGSDTLVLTTLAGLTAVNLGVAGGSDQTTGDATAVTAFENVDASALSAAQSVTLVGSSGANALSGGSGADTIDGSGGADTIVGGAGDDRVAYWGTEASIDGGTGNNTLQLKASGSITSVNLGVAAGSDETVGDAVSVVNFQNIDASALLSTQAITITGSSGANSIIGGSGADTIDGFGGLDVIQAGSGADQVTYRGTETSVDGGAGNDTLVIDAAASISAIDLSVTAGTDQSSGDTVSVTNFESVDASARGAGQAITLTGSTGANTLTGGAGADTIHGGSGADVVSAGAGDDRVDYVGSESSVDGGSGTNTLVLTSTVTVDLGATDQTVADAVTVHNFQNVDAATLGTSQGVSITGSSAGNLVTGGAGADTIDGGGGADTISGGAGNDSIAYRATETTLDGGTGTNTLVLKVAATVDLGAVDQTVGDSTTVTSFQGVDASALSSGVSLTGSTGADAITGGSGNDTIDGIAGLDVVNGGAGNDLVSYRGTEASIDGSTGTDTLTLKALGGISTIDLSAALDQTTGDSVGVTGFENVDASILTAGQGIGIVGTSSANILTGGAGADTIDGQGGTDQISAAAGNDRVSYRGTETSIDGGTGTNTLVLKTAATVDLAQSDQTTGDATTVSGFQAVDASALSAALTLSGTTGIDTIIGGSGADTIDGRGGADSLDGGAGDDTVNYRGGEAAIEGGLGTDTLVLKALGTISSINLALADQTLGDTTGVTGFENVDASVLGAAQGLAISGTAAANVITGGSGADTIHGADGADVIQAGAGDDAVDYWGNETSIDGGTGANTLVMKNVVTVDLSASDQTAGDGTTVNRFQNVDASGFTSAQSVSVTGSAGGNVIATGAGDDTIDGNGGTDAINAGAGNDTVNYRGTETSIAGGSGTDTLILKATGGITAIDLSVASGADQTTGDTGAVTDFENVDASILNSAQTITIVGSSAANRITGGAGNDTIRGGGGADTIAAGAGDDRVDFWANETSIDGGSGTNTLVLKVAATIDLSLADQSSGDATTVSAFQNVDASGLTVAQAATISGSISVNTLTGGAGADTIDGAGGADIVQAGAGDDTVNYRGTEAVADGGTGTDTLVLKSSGGITAIDLSVSAGADQTTGDIVSATNFENADARVLGAAQGITITGSGSANAIWGGAGADTIRGGGGGDTIAAGGGDDSVDYWGTESSIDGGTGTNTLTMQSTATINLGNADQSTGDIATVTAFQNVDASALSSAQGVSITGSAGGNRLTGGSGADTIDGAGGADTISAGGGNDTVAYWGSEVTIDGGTGVNTLALKSVATVNLGNAADQTATDSTTVTGFQNADASALSAGVSITGSAGANTIVGGGGADTIDGATGADSISAGGGDDTVDYRGTEAGLDGGGGTNTLILTTAASVNLGNADQTSGDATAVANFHNVDGSGLSANLSLTGSSGDNVLTGGSGNDTLHGADGADALDAGSGNDTVDYWGHEISINGGLGTDTLVMKVAATINLGAASDQTTSDATNVQGFDNVDAGSLSSGVQIAGNAQANTIVGGAGDDTIDGATGADVIDGGSGNDTITFRGTEASLAGGSGTDTLVLAVQGGITTIDLSVASGADQTVGDTVTAIDFENADASILSAGQAITLVGSSAGNVLKTGAGADTIHGGGGGDAILAGAGNDLVDYWGTEDSIDGGTGTNTLVMKSATVVNLANADQTTGDRPTVTGFANVDGSGLTVLQSVMVTGSSAANVITGGAGADTIDGNGGLDVITGGAGDDTVTYRGVETSLAGGSGADTLVLAAGGGITSIDLGVASGSDQTTGDTVSVVDFESVNASVMSTAVTITGGTGANTLIGGSGADTIDGGTGSDSIMAGGGNDTIVYRGSEAAIDGGTGTNKLILQTATDIDLGNVDQTNGDLTGVSNFQNIDASALSSGQAISLTGSNVANNLIGGAGADTIDGAGGADTITAGAGNDTVSYRATEGTIDGGTGTNTLLLQVAATVDLSATADQTLLDTTTTTNFQAVDAHLLSTGVSITGTTSGDTVIGGDGADTVHGAGGSDSISTGLGADSIDYWGSEASIDGGNGADMLVMKAAYTVNLANVDQTTGDTADVANMENVDASGLSTAVSLTGSGGANTMTGGSGADWLNGGGGTDVIDGGAGDDGIAYWGSEVSIAGGSGNNTIHLWGVSNVDLTATTDQTTGDSVTVTGFSNVNASGLGTSVSITGTSGANTLIGGGVNDTIDGGGGADSIDGGTGADYIYEYGTETTINGNTGTDRLVLKAGTTVTAVDLTSASDQTTGDTVNVLGFEYVNATASTNNLTITASGITNNISTGAGADTIHGGGGYDSIASAGGNDTVDYYGSEGSIDGGSGINTLVAKVGALVDLNSTTDQTTGDTAVVTNFSSLDGSGLTAVQNLNVLGTSGANTISGGAGIDTIDGGGGADVIASGSGDDTLYGYGSETSIDAGAGNDWLVFKAQTGLSAIDLSVAAGSDQTTGDTVLVKNVEYLDTTAVTQNLTITGTTGFNWIFTGAGNDTIDGLTGGDGISAGGGNDSVTYRNSGGSLDGGTGTNTLVMQAAATVALAQSSDQTVSDTTTVTNFQNIDASALIASQGSTLSGTTSANSIIGGAGNDLIDGGAGADTIAGGAGNDGIWYHGTETGGVDGGTGTDTLYFANPTALTAVDLTSTGDQTTGDSITVTGFENVSIWSGGLTQSITVTAGAIANSIGLGSGNDTIHGGGGADAIDGYTGNDQIDYYGSETSIDGNLGNDTLILLTSSGLTAIDLSVTTGTDQTTGDTTAVYNFENIDATALSSNLAVTGAATADTIKTGSGNDTIHGSGGADSISAGAGNDSVDYWATETAIDGGLGTNTLVMKVGAVVDLTSSTDQTSSDTTTVTNFISVDGSGLSSAQTLTVTGTGGSNTILGGSGYDTIDGGGGADSIYGGSGLDRISYYGTETVIDGGVWSDTLVLKAYGNATVYNLNTNSTTDQTTGDTVAVYSFENLDASILTAAQSITVTGTTSYNTITGGAGNDTIHGLGGLDSLVGGAGNDQIDYWGTEASIVGGTGTNTLIMLAGATVDLTAGDQTTSDTTSVSGFQNVDASALSTGLAITGQTSSANTITGTSGDDTIHGGGGADVISAGNGNDTVDVWGTETTVAGGGGTNTLALRATMTVDLTAADQTTGDSANTTGFLHVDASALSSAQMATITGTTAANTITGGAGNDTIHGNGGADVIAAGSGNDTVDEAGAEASIDGGTGTDKLVLLATSGVTAIDLTIAGADQTTGDTMVVKNFEGVDASAMTTAIAITGTTGAESMTGGSGNDTITGGGSTDVIVAGGGADSVDYWATETSIDGGTGTDTLVFKVAGSISNFNLAATAGTDQTAGDTTSVTNFEGFDASLSSTAMTATGTASANTLKTGSGNDTIDGAGGADTIAAGGGNDTVSLYGAEGSIDGGTGTNTLVLKTAYTVNLANTSDQTTGDTPTVTNFVNIDASALSSALSLTGDSNANLITSGSGNDTITGAAGADTIRGGGGTDSISAGSENDTVDYWASETAIDGGTGTDTLIMKSGATVNLGNADQTTSDTTNVTGFENVDASALSSGVSITGQAAAVNTIIGGSGADTIDGAGGADVITAGGGADTVSYWGAEASIDGGTGSNTLVLKAAATIDLSVTDVTTSDAIAVNNFSSVDGSTLSSNLSLTGSSGANTILAGSGADTIHGAGGLDSINAGSGNDSIDFWGSESTIIGGGGTDTLVMKAAYTVNLGNADQTTGDTANVSGMSSVDGSGLSSNLTITGSSGANTLTGGTGADTLDGNGGADSINGGTGNDSISYWGTETAGLVGGGGTDTLVLKAAVTVNLANADATTGDSVSATGFTNVDGSALSSNLTLTGSSGANTMTGGSGADTITGGGGADSINGGSGNDTINETGSESTLDGGANTDLLIASALTNITAVDLTLVGADQTTGDTVTAKNFESFDGSALSSNLTVTGGATANAITTAAGADTIHGGGGADAIVAGSGNDTVDFWGTETSIDGGLGNADTLVMKAVYTINLGDADQTTGDTPTVTGFENADGSGLSSNLTLTGSSSGNALTGGSGADTINGGGGNDTIIGGGGNDTITEVGAEATIDGGANTDTLIAGASSLITSMNLSVVGSDQTGGDGVTAMNFENFDGSALSANLTVTGSSSANTVTGGSGNDTITGGGGADVLAGGSGADRFQIDGSSLSLGATIDGGSGSDTVAFTAGTYTVTDSQLLSSLTNVEAIDFTAAGVTASVSLSGAQISQMDGGAANTLTLNLNSGDSFTLTDAAANYTTTSGGTGITNYTIYTDATHTTVAAHLTTVVT